MTDETDNDGISIHNSNQSETSTIEPGSSTSSLRRISLDTTPSSVGSAASSIRQVVNEEINASASSADASLIRRACRYDCFCICHAPSVTDASKGILKLSGLKLQCTESDCQGAGSTDDKAGIPSFFRRAISEVMSSRSIKVRYHLNTYRMVPEGSDALRYVKHGNLEKLKACIQTGEATLWDTAPDGWSLLHVSSSVLKFSERAKKGVDRRI